MSLGVYCNYCIICYQQEAIVSEPTIFQIRLTDEDREMFEELARVYPGLSKSDLVRFALEHVLRERPTFTIAPVGKVQALAAVAA